jgi:imidazolonepropionase-like amidohydrolase
MYTRLTILCLSLLCISCLKTSPSRSEANIWFKNGFIVNVNKEVIEKKDLFICDEVIVDEEKGQDCYYKEIDVKGKWIIPGLHDMHVHAKAQSGGDGNYYDEMSPNEEARIFLAAGVTSFLDAMQDEKVIFPARESQNTFESDILCVGAAFTPTGGHGTEYNLPASSYRIVDTPTDAINQVNDISSKKPDAIKIMYDHRGFNGETIKDGEKGALGVAMKKEVMATIVKQSKSLGLTPYVHIGVWKDAKDAIEAGASIINHLGESPIPMDLANLAKKNSVYWIPTLTLYHDYLNILANPKVLNDPLLTRITKKGAIDSYRPDNILIDPDYIWYQTKHIIPDPISIKRLLTAGVKLVAGSDTIEIGTFVGWSLHREMALFVKYGLSPWQALATATVNAGDMLGKNYGIEPGGEGSIVILNASPIDDIWNTTKIDKVIHHGKQAYPLNKE